MRIVAFAYACEPGAGSEPGAGWMWARILARFGETWVITRANNREDIERALPKIRERDSLHFVYIDLPSWARFWKRGNFGARPYYMLWQLAAMLSTRRLDRKIGFDISWHLTMSTVWLGSLAPFVGRNFILGPVGGGVRMPWRLVGAIGVKGTLFELARRVVQIFGRYLNPLARLSWRRSDLILVQNPETRDWLPKRLAEKVDVFPHVVLEESRHPVDRKDGDDGQTPRAGTQSLRRDKKVALFAGRLLHWKGLGLAVRALAQRPGWRLVVCGSGPDEPRLRRLSSRLGVQERIDWRGWLDRDEVLKEMEQASVFLFPSLHDEGGWVILESFANGLPVVCLDVGGPPVLGGTAVPIGGLDVTVRRLAEALDRYHHLDVRAHVPDIDEAHNRLAPLIARTGHGDLSQGRHP